MHPDLRQLAAYLDGALDPSAHAGLRAHILTCASCAARVERLRDDARRIPAALASGAPPPDVRAAVRARLSRPAFGTWLARGVALAGAAAALLLFAALLGAGSSGTGLRVPDRLFVTDRRGEQLVVLDAASGARLAMAKLGAQPGSVAYDAIRDRLYIVLKQSVVAIDPRSLQPVARWIAAQPLDTSANLALDPRAGRLYVVRPAGIVALDLDAPELTIAASYDLGAAISSLALAPDGATLFALDPRAVQLWAIDTRNASSRAIALGPAAPAATRSGWLAIDRDGRSVYVLLTQAFDGGRPGLWRVTIDGGPAQSVALAFAPPPWDLELLDNGRLAIPRGNGSVGGVELLDTATLSTTARLDQDHDQHHVVVGPSGSLFALNFTHSTVTCYSATTQAVLWRTPADADYQPWDGVLVRGGWRWPWERG